MRHTWLKERIKRARKKEKGFDKTEGREQQTERGRENKREVLRFIVAAAFFITMEITDHSHNFQKAERWKKNLYKKYREAEDGVHLQHIFS